MLDKNSEFLKYDFLEGDSGQRNLICNATMYFPPE